MAEYEREEGKDREERKSCENERRRKRCMVVSEKLRKLAYEPSLALPWRNTTFPPSWGSTDSIAEDTKRHGEDKGKEQSSSKYLRGSQKSHLTLLFLLQT